MVAADELHLITLKKKKEYLRFRSQKKKNTNESIIIPGECWQKKKINK